jgi:putative endonuclease
MFVVYILYSAEVDRFYIGQTEDYSHRLDLHQQKFFKGSFTVQAKDWATYLIIDCVSRVQSVNIESHIKRMKSRKYILNLNQYPEMIEKLKKRFEYGQE